jgi:hypothetical protein
MIPDLQPEDFDVVAGINYDLRKSEEIAYGKNYP